MKKNVIYLFLIAQTLVFSQNFKVKGSGDQKFLISERVKGNQIQFTSNAPLEDIQGTAAKIDGVVTFNLSDFAGTIKAKISVPVNSMNTGIELRNKHMMSANWLDEQKYPLVSFELSSVSNIKQLADNRLSFNVSGVFTLHGVSKEISASAEAVYLTESEQTAQRGPGDLIGISADFNLKLSDFKVQNSIIGNKVAENIKVKIFLVGSNKI